MDIKTQTSTNILKESWRLVSGLKMPVFLINLMVAISVFILMISIIIIIIFPLMTLASMPAMNHSRAAAPTGISMSSFFLTSIICLLVGAFYWFCTAMLIMLGVRQAVGLSLSIKTVFNDCKKAAAGIYLLYLIWVVLFATLLMLKFIASKIGVIGTLIYFVGIAFAYYVSLALTIFSLPLIVTKHHPFAIDAIKDGLQRMNANWKLIIPLFVMMAIIINISALFLGLGLIWTLPMFYAAVGICFRDVYGCRK